MSLRKLFALVLVAFALVTSVITIACKSSSDDCAPFPTQWTYNCEPLEAGEASDDAVVCAGDADSGLTYPAGCTATSTIAAPINNTDDPSCRYPVQCTCQSSVGAASGQFGCPD